MVGMTTPDPTPLTPESEALLSELTLDETPEGAASWRRSVVAIETAVTARVLADVAARLPEALKAAAQEMCGDTYDRQWLEAFAPFLAAHLTGGTR